MTEAVPVGCGERVQQPQAVLATAPDAYIAVDAADRVLRWNPAAETISATITARCAAWLSPA